MESLKLGSILVLPTETVYGLAVLLSRPNAVARLSNFKGRRPGHVFTIAMASAAKVQKLLPNLSPLAKRFARRCWPGPLTMVLDMNPCSIAIPEPIRQMIAPTGTIGIRVPAHPVTLAVLEALDEPLVLTSANLSGSPPACTAHDAIETLPPGAEIVINGGPCEYSEASTVVRVRGWEYEILRRGVYSEEMVHRLATRVVVFVCTGNTCRSPMAEVLCQNILERGGRSGLCPASATEIFFPGTQNATRSGFEGSVSNAVDDRGCRVQPSDWLGRNDENGVRTKVATTGEVLVDEEGDSFDSEDVVSEEDTTGDIETENVEPMGTTSEGVASENVATEGVATEGVASEGIEPKCVVSEGVASEDVAPKEMAPREMTPGVERGAMEGGTLPPDIFADVALGNELSEVDATPAGGISSTVLEEFTPESIASKGVALNPVTPNEVASNDTASNEVASKPVASKPVATESVTSKSVASEGGPLKTPAVPRVGAPRSGAFWPRGVAAVSAGLAAFDGDTISTLARQTLALVGLDPGQHKSHQLNEKMLRDADVIFAMAAGHLRAVVSRWPFAADRIQLLSPDGRDIIDPYGTSLQTYQQCARQILTTLYQRVDLLRDPIDRTVPEPLKESQEDRPQEGRSQEGRIPEAKAG